MTVAAASSVDWTSVVAFVGAGLGGGLMAIKGWFDKRKETRAADKPVIGFAGIVQDNAAVHAATAATEKLRDELEDNTRCIERNTEALRSMHSALTRSADLILLQQRGR